MSRIYKKRFFGIYEVSMLIFLVANMLESLWKIKGTG